MNTITITHTPEDGTLALGTERGDHAGKILRDAGRFTFSRGIGVNGAWYIKGSRDRAPRMWAIDAAVEKLRAAGFDVDVQIEREYRATAEVEADRAASLESRQDALEDKADRKAAESDAAYARSRDAVKGIPVGQPVLADHYSAPGHLRAIDRSNRAMRASVDADNESREAAHRAEASRASQAHRDSVPVTLRRIERLTADLGRFQRALDGTAGPWSKPATGADRGRILGEIEHLTEQIAHWRKHVATLEEEGVKVWSKADFKVGDFVRSRGSWREVLRVNPKSVTVPSGWGRLVTQANREYSWNDTIKYDDVSGRKSAEEMAKLLAAAEAAKETAEASA
ncbi:DUF3560 domain-containing protein [Actinopolymorpha sp. B17G11]|uniref:DUF3560 domain-containing protein n=1 Tax=Actinopolymorpha sp. B17G11 TaxID=3160861 RepID=UPI0032E38239